MDRGYTVKVQYGPLLRQGDAQRIRRILSRIEIEQAVLEDRSTVSFTGIDPFDMNLHRDKFTDMARVDDGTEFACRLRGFKRKKTVDGTLAN